MLEKKPINKSKYLYYKISKLLYILGAPNYWYKDFEIPDILKKFHDNLAKLSDVLIWVFFVAIFGSHFTQHNLNEKQNADRNTFTWCLPVYYIVIPTIIYHKEKVREVAYNLSVKMKESYNDIEVEKDLLKQVKIYYSLFGFLVFSMTAMYGVNGVLQIFTKKDANFVTVITVWPDIDDASRAAGITRVVIYVIFWVYMIRVQVAAYIPVVLITISLGHQYKNLNSYFHSLQHIFDDEELNHEERERKYEEAYKVGIEMHANTIKCTKRTQEICSVVFSVQLIFNVIALILIMFQMMNSERTPSNAVIAGLTGFSTLTSTGCLWWNAGNITVEASHLSTAMFHSGWHHCRKEVARRIRPMLVISMSQSQVPVELRCLGVIKLSYQSYVTIVRTSYSIFSVIY